MPNNIESYDAGWFGPNHRFHCDRHLPRCWWPHCRELAFRGNFTL